MTGYGIDSTWEGTPTRPPRRGRLISRVELHIAQWAPLFALLGWRFRGSVWSWFFLVLAAVGLLLMALSLLGARMQEPDPFKFDVIEDLGDQVTGHVVGYLLPFVIGPHPTYTEAALVAAVLGVLSVIQIQSNRVHLNPLLYLIGYRIYSASSKGNSYYLLARSDLTNHTEALLAAEIPGGILIERRG